MTVAQLRELLLKYPQDMEVVTTRYSDTKVLTEDDINTIECDASTIKDGWLSRWYPGMESKTGIYGQIRREKRTFVHFEGN